MSNTPLPAVLKSFNSSHSSPVPPLSLPNSPTSSDNKESAKPDLKDILVSLRSFTLKRNLAFIFIACLILQISVLIVDVHRQDSFCSK